jgi:transposase InsO family protein
VRFDFIRQQMKAYLVTVLCAVMRVSRSGFYDYLDRYNPDNDNRPEEARLRSRIKEIFDQSRASYGSRRIVKKLNKDGRKIGRYKVRRIMRQIGLKAKTPKRFKLTTDSRHSFTVANNVLDRNFDVDTPNKVWTADISYVWTFEGWLYLAIIMDLYSRQIVGWAMDKRMKKDLTLNALSMAYWQRKPDKGLLHHSDRGSQYACHEYRKQLENYSMTASMSRKGNCWDNAPTERFFRSLKSERLTACRFLTRNDAKNEILDYITYYNSIRLHSTLEYLSPMEYEKEQYLKAA